MAHIGVFAVDRGQVEVGGTAVVKRQHALVLVRCAGVKGPGLQGLQHVAPEPAGFAFKHQPGIQAEGRQHPVHRRGPVVQCPVHLVARGVQLQLGRHEAPGANPGAADLGLHKAALAVARQNSGAHQACHTRVVGLKTRGVAHHRPVQAFGIPLPIAHGDLRCSVVRRRGFLQVLPALHLCAHAEVAPTPGQHARGR